MAQFQTNPWALTNLLEMLDQGRVVLPEFQRSFVWRPLDIDMLLTSLVQDYPAGSLLFLRADPSNPLAWRLVEGIDGDPLLVPPDYLMLDGQQRLTSLSLALNARGDHLFFMDLAKLEEEDLEGGIYPLRRNEAKSKGLLDRKRQWELHVYPLWAAAGSKKDYFWFQDYQEFHTQRGADREEFRARARELELRYVEPLRNYRFPVVELPADTSLEAVCQIFETLNKTGMKLTVFDLLTARFWPQKLDLRAMFETTRQEYHLLGEDEFDIEPTFLLQAVSLLRSGLCKRGDLLLLEREGFEEDWERVCAAASSSLALLRNECGVLTRRWLPYASLFPSLFAVATQVQRLTGPSVGAAWEKIKRWFWCSTFGQRYEGPINTLNATDYREVSAWLEDDAALPEAVSKFRLEEIDLRRVERQRNAVYRGVICLTVVNGGRDFHSANRLTAEAVRDPHRGIEDHHLFPSGYLKKLKPPRPPESSILNRCLIDQETNRLIRDKAPSRYLAEIADQLGADKLEEILGSHVIPSSGQGALADDDIDGFLSAREKLLLGAIASVTGAVIPEIDAVEIYLDPKMPFTNELALRRVLRGLKGKVFWYEQHMSRNVLEMLAEDLDREAVSRVALLSGGANISERTKRAFERFAVELGTVGIEAEWRILPDDVARGMHVRFLFDEYQAWELPPLNSLLKGTVDSIRPTKMPKRPFLEAWDDPAATPIDAFHASA